MAETTTPMVVTAINKWLPLPVDRSESESMVRDDEVVVNPSTKKKTPLEYRMQKPKIKESEKPFNMAEKKLFKEAFNTDKSRLFKRHTKYGKKRNFIIIVEDSVLGKGAQTNGKLKVWARQGL